MMPQQRNLRIAQTETWRQVLRRALPEYASSALADAQLPKGFRHMITPMHALGPRGITTVDQMPPPLTAPPCSFFDAVV
jgi:hypothetical protein